MKGRRGYSQLILAVITSTLLGLLLAACSTTRQNLEKQRIIPTLLPDAPLTTIPMINAGNLQWRVTAMVDGVEGVFAVDTGAERTILNRAFAERAGLVLPEGTVQPIDSNSVGQVALTVPVDIFQLGGLDFVDFHALVLNLDHINRVMRTPIDGILGFDILGQAQCTFDWRNNTLTLDTRPRERPQNAIPVKIRGNRLYVDARVNSKTIEFRLDTGSYSTCLRPEIISRLHLARERIKMEMTPRIGIAESRELPQEHITVDSFLLGNINRKQTTLMAWDNTVLGMDLLELSVLTINPSGGWMTLTDSVPDR
jgi:predicted aspartyl protease